MVVAEGELVTPYHTIGGTLLSRRLIL